MDNSLQNIFEGQDSSKNISLDDEDLIECMNIKKESEIEQEDTLPAERSENEGLEDANLYFTCGKDTTEFVFRWVCQIHLRDYDTGFTSHCLILHPSVSSKHKVERSDNAGEEFDSSGNH